MNRALRRIITQLTTLRITRGITQAQLGKQAGLSADVISDIETMRFQPVATNIANIAEALGQHLTITPQATALLDTTADIGTELRRLRKEAHLTLDQLGQATGIAPTNLSSYENDRRRPDLDTILRIVAGLGCRLAIISTR